MDGWRDGRMDGWMDGWTDGWICSELIMILKEAVVEYFNVE
jgi:hypothetical protein